MGFRQWLGLAGPLTQKRIDKSAKLATNAFAQPDVRMREMQRLRDDGSAAAITGLLGRLKINAQGHIADEEEKRWLCDALIELGDVAKEPLESYIGQEDKLTYALATYERIFGGAAAVPFFCDTLQAIGPGDHRRQEAKLQLAVTLGDHLSEGAVLPTLACHLRDHSDDVRWTVLDIIERAATQDSIAPGQQQTLMPHLGWLVSDQSVSVRIARRAADVLASQNWALADGQQALNPALEDVYLIDKKQMVRKRLSA